MKEFTVLDKQNPACKIKERVKKAADQLGITEVLSKYPYQMSGGQKQRVAAARAVTPLSIPESIFVKSPLFCITFNMTAWVSTALNT